MRKISKSAAVVALAALGITVTATPAQAEEPKPGDKVCDVNSEMLWELSGIAATEDGYVAISDGSRDQTQIDLVHLDDSCQETQNLIGAADPYDPEDLAVDSDGTFWVADSGDNQGNRPHIALHQVSSDGNVVTYRFSYPEGKSYDTEALLMQPDGTPIFATKGPGESLLFAPSGELDQATDINNPLALENVGSVKIDATETPGGPEEVGGVPLGDAPSTMVTGGAVSPDGEKAVLRTYTDAYEWNISDGDVAGTLDSDSEPTVTPLPDEPQGEAISYTSDGKKFVTASEGNQEEGLAPQVWTYEPAKAASKKSDKDKKDDEAAGSNQSITDFLLDVLGPNGILMTIAAIGLLGGLLALWGVIVIVRSRKRRRRRDAEREERMRKEEEEEAARQMAYEAGPYDDDARPAPEGRRPFDERMEPPHRSRPDDGLSGGRLFDPMPPRGDDGTGTVYGGRDPFR